MDEKSLSHTSWNCKYHIVLVPKYRRKTIYGKLRKDIGKILRMLCDYKHVEIIEAHAMPDHIHMLLSIPPKLAVADFMGYLQGKSTRMIFERHANLKYKYGRRVFWTKGYCVNTVGGNEAKIRKYIRDQEAEDQRCDQLSFKEYEDPFKNVADFDDDDSPEVPTDRMRKQERRQYAVDVAHCAPLGAAGIVAPMGPFCIPRVSTRGYDCSTPLRKRERLRMRRFRQGARKNKENFGKKREPGGLVLLICFLPAAPDRVPVPHPPARRKCPPGCDTRRPERPDWPPPGTR